MDSQLAITHMIISLIRTVRTISATAYSQSRSKTGHTARYAHEQRA